MPFSDVIKANNQHPFDAKLFFWCRVLVSYYFFTKSLHFALDFATDVVIQKDINLLNFDDIIIKLAK